MPTRYDVVYYWNGSEWLARRVPGADIAALEREVTDCELQGYPCRRGLVSIGAPDTAPDPDEIVAVRDRAQQILERAFEAVKPIGDWKAPIDCTVSLPRVEAVGGRRAIEQAIIHFTATVAEVTEDSRGLRFIATGYRLGPAGP